MLGRKLRVVQIGVGGFGACRRQRMRDTGLFEILGTYDWDQSAREDGIPAVASYSDLLAIPGVEAVIISTGAKFHAEQAIAAAQRGLHVFVEKPLCATRVELDMLLSVHKSSGVVIGVGHHDHSNDGLSKTIKQKIDFGELGSVATFEKTTAHNGGLMIQPGDWRGDPERNPGGMLFQCGVHAIHELIFYFGEVMEVAAMMRYNVHTTETADVATCQLRFKSGLIGTLGAYHVSPYRYTFNVFGTSANLYCEERFFDEGARLSIQRTKLDGQKEPRERVNVREATDLCANLRSFYNAVQEGPGGPPFYPSIIDGARAVAVVFAAEESARCGRTVPVMPV